MDELPWAWLADIPIACALVPNCLFALEHWFVAMGVPLAGAIGAGLTASRWRDALLTGLVCFGVHIAYQALHWYALSGVLSLPYGDLRVAVQVELGAIIFVIMTSAAMLAHSAKRFLGWHRRV